MTVGYLWQEQVNHFHFLCKHQWRSCKNHSCFASNNKAYWISIGWYETDHCHFIYGMFWLLFIALYLVTVLYCSTMGWWHGGANNTPTELWSRGRWFDRQSLFNSVLRHDISRRPQIYCFLTVFVYQCISVGMIKTKPVRPSRPRSTFCETQILASQPIWSEDFNTSDVNFVFFSIF